MRSVRFSIGLFAPVFSLLLVFPSAASAAYWVDRLPKSDSPVSRGTFIRAVVDLGGLSADTAVELPYRRRVPAGLKGFVGTAYKSGALEVFGSELNPARPITVGEALQVLTKLNKLSADSVTITFLDVPKRSALEEAVKVAISKHWMEPASEKRFGADQVLTGNAARTLLRKVAQEDETNLTTVIRFQQRTKQPLPKEEMLQAIWQLLDEQYLYEKNINADEMAYSAAEAMVNTLNDPYTAYLRPLPSQEFQSRIEGKVEGIGAQVEYRNNALLIVSPIAGSPAAKAGLLPEDEILQADGVSLANMSFLEAVNKVRGKVGTTVRLHIRRGADEFDVTVARAVIDVPEINVSWQGNVAVVQLVQFGERTERELRGTLQNINDRSPSGIVFDLRNNPGGLLHAAGTVVGNFLPQDTVYARIKTRDDRGETMYATEDPPTVEPSVPLALLVNRGSASSSEIVAGALQDYGRATIVGETTFGKGTVQQIVDFKDGSSLKMTIAEWYTPGHRRIEGEGIQPDIVVTSTGERDEQLLRALELLRR